MLALLPAVAVAVLAPLVSGIKIVQPTSAGWLGNSTVELSWTWDNSDPHFSVELGNVYIKSGLLSQGPIALANNIDPATSSLAIPLPVLPAADNYFVALVAVNDVNQVYANSSLFPIRDNPTSTTASLSSFSTTPRSTTNTRTSTSHPGNQTTTGTSSTPSTTSSPTSTSDFTSLVISTTTTTTTTSKTGGAVLAANMEAAWYVGAVGAFLGAIFA